MELLTSHSHTQNSYSKSYEVTHLITKEELPFKKLPAATFIPQKHSIKYSNSIAFHLVGDLQVTAKQHPNDSQPDNDRFLVWTNKVRYQQNAALGKTKFWLRNELQDSREAAKQLEFKGRKWRWHLSKSSAVEERVHQVHDSADQVGGSTHSFSCATCFCLYFPEHSNSEAKQFQYVGSAKSSNSLKRTRLEWQANWLEGNDVTEPSISKYKTLLFQVITVKSVRNKAEQALLLK